MNLFLRLFYAVVFIITSLVIGLIVLLCKNPRWIPEHNSTLKRVVGGVTYKVNHSRKVDRTDFYSQYHGHPIDSITQLHASLRKDGKRIVWLLGDSSLDNKYWIRTEMHSSSSENLCNGYEKVLDYPLGINDVCLWLNHTLCERSTSEPLYAAINCAVEATTLYDRREALLEQDAFVMAHLEKDDIIIVSIGGNDVVLNPSFQIGFSLALIFYLLPDWFFWRLHASSWILWPLYTLFRRDLIHYIDRICLRQTPSKIILCSYYYPCTRGNGWADLVLKLVGYNKEPEKIQHLFDILSNGILPNQSDFPLCDSFIKHNLSTVLSADDPNDYLERVEPSSAGGKKMAESFCHLILS